MDTLKASVLSILMLTLIANLLAVANVSEVTGHSDPDLVSLIDFSTFPADHVFSAKEMEGRQVEDLVISVDGAGLTLTWSAAPGAVSYKVYSALSPDLAFSEDSAAASLATAGPPR